MIATILAFFATFLGKSILAALGVTGLGMLRGTAPYKATRAGWGKLLYKAGALLSAFGKTKLGMLWQPAEESLLDFGGFGVEQFCAGLRSDNLDKLGDQLDRLEGVDSVTRGDAIAEKILLLTSPASSTARDFRNAAIAYRANLFNSASINQHLGE